MTSIKDAATQAESVWLDLAGSVKKVIDLTAEAAGKGARIIAFSEVWLAGYPAWIGARQIDMDLQTRYAYNSLSPSSLEMDSLLAAANEHEIAVVLGFAELRPQTARILPMSSSPRKASLS